MERCIYFGMPISEFYELSIAEIEIYLRAHADRHKNDLQNKAQIAYTQAHLIGEFVIMPWSKHKIEPTSIYEAFPSLFERPKQQDWRRAKENMMKYAAAHNQKYEVNNGSRTINSTDTGRH